MNLPDRGIVFYGRTGTFTWRMVAVVLVAQSLCVFFGALVAWSLASAGAAKDQATTYLWVGCALALLCFLAAGLMRGPVGIAVAWSCQVLTLATALIVPMMGVIGLLFLALFLVCLVQGARLDALRARHGDATSG